MNSIHRKKVAFIVSSIGFHWEELAAAYQFLIHAGVEVNFFTPSGKIPVADSKSLVPRKYFSLLGIGAPLNIAPLSEFGKSLWENLRKFRSIVEMNTAEYAGLYLPGGHGCLFDVNTNSAVQNRILEFYQAGKPLAAVCHATSAFAFIKKHNLFIVEGKSLTGFPELMDDLLIQFNGIDPQFLPIPFSNDGKLISSHAKNPIEQRLQAFFNPKFYVVDLPFITGVGPKAASSVAQKLSENLK